MIELNKMELRKDMKMLLKNMTEEDYCKYSSEIKEKLISSHQWYEAKTIGITISTDREVDTRLIIEEGWKQNKTIVVPKCIPEKKQLVFYKITSFSEVEDSFYSLKEPITAITSQVDKANIDLIIVPGLIYDKEGYRVGFGGGYYDRYLKNYHGDTIALAFKFQITGHVPKEDHDIPVGKIISNT